MSDRFNNQDQPQAVQAADRRPVPASYHAGENQHGLASRIFGSAVESLLMTPEMSAGKKGTLPHDAADVIKALQDMSPMDIFKSAEKLAERGADALTFGACGVAAKLGLDAARNYYEHSKSDSLLSGLLKHDVNYQGPPQAHFGP